jgi:outer membrane protein OmpA-like peptidoglycan-associated protein
MKKIILLYTLIFSFAFANAQSESYKKPSTIGLHFFYNDFKTTLFNNPNTMFSGLGADYLKGLTKKIDAVGTFNASWVNYILPSSLPYGSNHFLLDINAGAHIKMFNDAKTFNPFIIAKIGYTKYKNIGGFSALPGAGVQIKVYPNTFIFSTMEYRKALNSSISNQLYYSIGIASSFGKSKTKTEKSKSVAVSVKDEATGLPLPNAAIVLIDKDGNETTAITNAEGKAIFEKIKTGNYTVKGKLNKIETTNANIIDADFKTSNKDLGINLTHNDPRFTLVGNTVNLQSNTPIGGTQVTANNASQGSATFATSKMNSGEFSIQLEANSDFEIVGKKASYISNIENISTKGLNRSTTLYVKLQLGIEEATAGKNIVLNKIYFETGSAAVNANTSADLKKLIQFMTDNPSTNLEIEGHTDNVGNEQSNKELSQQRANKIVAYLVANGIDKQRLNAIGYGSKKPIANNNTTDGKAKNRRVEMKVVN